jgi:hypothetical protein
MTAALHEGVTLESQKEATLCDLLQEMAARSSSG